MAQLAGVKELCVAVVRSRFGLVGDREAQIAKIGGGEGRSTVGAGKEGVALSVEQGG